ncbi:sulfotransferase [Novosphingobium sp.]|uniref:tetratricopeptide repeat-containing sulfotransferase family protein n=1 Tax=Novosphingobium sp. TaxID=1874826 RepID=UPI0035AECA41
MTTGCYREASAQLGALELLAANVGDWRQLGQFYSHLGNVPAAMRAFEHATIASGGSAETLYDLGISCIAVGDFARAESLLEQVIALRPDDWDAWANRSTIRKATSESNHVDALKAMYGRAGGNPDCRIALGFALAKELEDLGEYAQAFEYLAEAAQVRRQRLSYSVAQDAATMEMIAAAFPATEVTRDPRAGPIFILGLPRSGTTLVDRILSSHSAVESLGEIQDFALALVGLAGQSGDKRDLIKASAAMDHASLGAEYLRRISERRARGPYVIDKTPLNFLYIGLIARALPSARIVHVRRGAMDSAYAMFKTLFRMGYPFSYAQDDLAKYCIAYRKLMAHWRAALPGRLIEIDYEVLVADQEAESRRLVAACGLEWQDKCLSFHRNATPVTTASAAQVRSPIHDRSIGLWYKYRAQLAPLVQAFTDAGIPLDHSR